VIRSGCSAPLSGVVIDRGRRPGRVGGDVVLSDLSDQRVAHEDVVDQFLASPIDAAEALGFGDAWGQIHSRCRSPWSGWLRPRVPISDPVGPLRIWVVAASTSSLRSPSTITDVWLSLSSLFRRAVAVARTVTASAARRYRA
jgi:hypothetical protein